MARKKSAARPPRGAVHAAFKDVKVALQALKEIAEAHLDNSRYSMTNAEVVEDHRDLETLQLDMAAAEEAFALITAVYDPVQSMKSQLQGRVHTAENVTDITQSGLGLSIHAEKGHNGYWTKLAVVGREGRSAEIYPNAHNEGKTSGLKIYPSGRIDSEKFLGASWMYEEALAEARFWLVSGVEPQRQTKTKKD